MPLDPPAAAAACIECGSYTVTHECRPGPTDDYGINACGLCEQCIARHKETCSVFKRGGKIVRKEEIPDAA